MRRVELAGDRPIDRFESLKEHESGSEDGMTAVVVETDSFDV